MDMVFFRDAMIHLIKVHKVSYTDIYYIIVLAACYVQGRFGNSVSVNMVIKIYCPSTINKEM